MAVNIAEQTVVDSYNIVKTITGGTTTAAPTTFPFGVTSGDIDLLLPKWGGKGTETKGYRLGILVTAKPAGTGTLVITGASEGGPEEQICSLALDNSADITESDDWRIMDTMTLASATPPTPTHLAACSILVADSGNGRPAKLGFDAIGYRYIKFYVTALTTITDLRIYARFF